MTRNASRVLAAIAILSAVAILVVAVIGSGDEPVWGLAWLGFPVVGGILLWLRPSNRIGLLMLLIGVCTAVVQGVTWALVDLATTPSTTWEIIAEVLGAAIWLLTTAIVLVFPHGRVNTSLERILVWAVVGVGLAIGLAYATSSEPLQYTGRANPWAVGGLASFARFMAGPGFALALLLMLAALVALVLRWRRGSTVERLQIRWFALAVSVALVSLAVLNARVDAAGPAALVLALAVINLIPAAIGLAVLRYRLYDIDRIVSRTTSYAIVTALLLATYAVVVTVVLRLLPDSSSLAVATATLAAAGIARPAVHRVQRMVDRRFDRTRYDQETIAGRFGDQVRVLVRPEDVTSELLSAVRSALQPSRSGMWLAGSTR